MMDSIKIIAYMLLVATNACCILYISREFKKLANRVEKYLNYTNKRYRMVLVNQLLFLRSELVKNEDYKSAAEINEIIKREIENENEKSD